MKTMAKAQEFLYAVVGAGDFAVEKAKNFPKATTRKNAAKLYRDFVKRGKTLSNTIGSSAPTRKAVAQTKTARRQVKPATTSVTKAARANAKATKAAAEKTTQAS